MADRKASVALELKAGQFKAEVTESAAKVEGLDRQVDKLDRSITKIPPDAAKAAAAMKLLGTEADGVGRRVQGVGDKSKSMNMLDDAIVHTRGEVRRLADEFNRTGNVGILPHLLGANRDLKTLESFQKQLTRSLVQGVEDGGREGAKILSSELQGAVSTPVLGPAIAAAIAAGVLIALPAIGGLITAGVGLGGIALGIAGQFNDPAVHEAITALATDTREELTAATKGFREPLIDSVHIIDGDLKNAIMSLDLDKVARLLPELAHGLGGLLTNLGPGLNAALNSDALQELARLLPQIGTGISIMLKEIAAGGQGAKEGMRALVYILVGVLTVIGAIVFIVSKAAEAFIAFGDNAAKAIKEAFPMWPVIQKAAEAAQQFFDSLRYGTPTVTTMGRALTGVAADAALTADDMAKLSGEINKTAITADSLAAQMAGKLFGQIMNVDQAILGWHSSLLSLHDALSQNGLAIDRHTGLVNMNTQAGIGNRQAVLQAMTANMQQYQSFIAAGGAADVATATYNSNTAALEKQLRAAGYNKAQIDDMIGSLKNVPGKVAADIAMHGLTDAINNLGVLLAELNHLNAGSYGFTVTEKHVYESDYVTHRLGEDLGRASGGPVVAGRRYVVGESGPEYFVPAVSGTIVPNDQLRPAPRWVGGGSAGGGGAVVNMVINAGMGADGAMLGRQIAEQLRPYINGYGGNVQVALGRRGQ